MPPRFWGRETPTRRPISAFGTPWAASSTIRARCANPASTVEERTSEFNLDSSPTRRTSAAATDTHHCPKITPQNHFQHATLGSFALAAFRSVVRNETAFRNARLPYRSSETSSPTGRRVVGPYLPSGQPRGITTHGVTFHGRPKARLASSVLHSGAVISAAPNPAARAPSKRFCTAG